MQGSFSKATTVNPKDLLGVQKVSITKLPFVSILHGAHAMMDGAGKYGPYNWRSNPVIASIYVDAAVRHLGDWFEGQETASDSGVHHLGHAIACCAILLDAQENKNLIDDRPICGNPELAASVLDRLSTVIKTNKQKKRIQYLAGIIDGEGNIGIVKRESDRNESYSVRLSVYSTNRELINSLNKEWGGTIVVRKPRKKEHAESYTLVWSHKKAVEIINSVSPFLIIKKEQAMIAVNFQSFVKSTGRAGLSKNTLIKMREFKEQLHKLNMKGPK